MADQVRRIAGRPLDDFVGSRQLAETPVPTLVIHAPDDREVPPGHAELYAQAGDHVRLRWAPGLGHRRILSDPSDRGGCAGFRRPPGSDGSLTACRGLPGVIPRQAVGRLHW